MKNLLTFLFVVITSNLIFAQIPAGYYDGTEGLEGVTLKLQLRNIIGNHTSISYNNLWNAFYETDRTANGQVWDIYSTCSFTFFTDQCGNYSDICDCYNREHTVPQSWFGGASPMVSDLFHVYPTDGKMNGYRSDYPYGECNNGTTYNNGLGKLGSCTYPGYSGTVFEPDDEYKGDLARTYFYMATRYDVSSWTGPSFSGDGFSEWTLNMLLDWHYADPVSQKEIDRNNAVYNIQHNRNPYIDHPEWVACVFQNICGVEPPVNLVATATSPTQINLTWLLNSDNNDVLLAYNTTNSFGIPTGSYSQGQTIDGGGNVLYVGSNTSYNHTDLSNQTYYYKLWSYNGTDYSTGIEANATPFLPEPSDNVTNFHVSNVGTTFISLAWNDADGTTPPTAYLIRMATDLDAIQNPVDGTTYSDNSTQLNVNQGTETCTFSGLEPETEYFFKIFPYTNSGSVIDYKTDGNPSTSATTLEITPSVIYISEIASKGYNMDFNNEYIELSNFGNSSVDLSLWTLEYYEGTNLEATLNLTGTIESYSAYVIAARSSYTSAITPDFVSPVALNFNNDCHIILKNNSELADVAGNESDEFVSNKNYEFTHCTQDNEPTANWDDLGLGNGTPGIFNCNDIIQDVTNLNTSCGDYYSNVSWTNPENFDEVILVVNNSFITGIPSGTYNANSQSYTDPLNPDFPGGGKVVYNGTDNSVSVTDLNANITYYFKVFTRLIDSWSNGVIENCSTVGIEEVLNNYIIVSPNPSFNGFFLLECKNIIINQIEVYDVFGKKIFSKVVDNESYILDLSKNNSGLYFLKIQTENEFYFDKIIIQ